MPLQWTRPDYQGQFYPCSIEERITQSTVVSLYLKKAQTNLIVHSQCKKYMKASFARERKHRDKETDSLVDFDLYFLMKFFFARSCRACFFFFFFFFCLNTSVMSCLGLTCFVSTAQIRWRFNTQGRNQASAVEYRTHTLSLGLIYRRSIPFSSVSLAARRPLCVGTRRKTKERPEKFFPFWFHRVSLLNKQ